jgi:sugar phosphate isomerase/epimerase
MLIGTMNHPAQDPLKEIEWMAEMGFDFVDLTLEPPKAGVRDLDLPAIRAALETNHLQVVGHTAYYLPLCCPFESIRRAAVEELKLCLEAFSVLGASWMNIHPDNKAPLHEHKFIIEKNLETIRELLKTGRGLGIGIMIENLPGSFNTVAQLAELLDAEPELGLHLDVGHANLMVERNTTSEILQAYGSRLRHVHLHDNKGGGADLHLPLGCGTVDTAQHIKALQASGYDGTITLEVFTPDRRHLSYSREVLRNLWDQTAAQTKSAKGRGLQLK